MYRVARNHDKIPTRQSWEFYLARAANTTIHMAGAGAPIGYMDGTIFREVLRSLLEEADAANSNSSLWGKLSAQLLAQQKHRAVFWSTAKYPYGSEFSYDTTGQEEVVVWLLYFGFEAAAKRTVDHILSYMRNLPNWSGMGGTTSGDVANGGKWLTTAGTGAGDFGRMHYRAG